MVRLQRLCNRNPREPFEGQNTPGEFTWRRPTGEENATGFQALKFCGCDYVLWDYSQ